MRNSAPALPIPATFRRALHPLPRIARESTIRARRPCRAPGDFPAGSGATGRSSRRLREAFPGIAFHFEPGWLVCPAWALLCSIEQFDEDWGFLRLRAIAIPNTSAPPASVGARACSSEYRRSAGACQGELARVIRPRCDQRDQTGRFLILRLA